jgi:hypothetical protein
MKKLEVSKILVLMVLSVGLIACGSVQQGLNDQGLSEEELALKRAEAAKKAPKDEGGMGYADQGKDVNPVGEGGMGYTVNPTGEGGMGYADQGKDVNPVGEGGMGFHAELADNILSVKGVADKGVTSIGFIFNGKEQFTAPVSKKDQSYMIKIELSDQDLKQLILDVVNGPKVNTIMITSGVVKVYNFKK